jgi:hypothetical protein
MTHRISSGQEDYIGDAEVLNLLESARKGFEQGDKSQLMWCIYRCARFQAVIPEWAVDALLKIQDDMESGNISDFNDAFGKPREKVNTRSARVRKNKLRPFVLPVLARLRLAGGSLNNAEIMEQAAEIVREMGHSCNQRDVKEIYELHGSFIKGLPRDNPERGFGIIEFTLPKPRRRGRNILQD